ncbi:SRPBCC family protein (plasmid) [Bradyrhizobium sp. CB82]|uniref:SRPBCC family protein n=1 Tax=Bradyrhizobium sp. CB82 TaxID=3039159 RepID=UPI0024B14892|nr:SRPBCC family protein [Bradyrhizobium sp. CB82]WFU45490.1 SRPBCC family protein [Bradyrhizobium sp. CB82]
MLERDATGKVTQRGICTLPDARELPVTVNDEQGTTASEGDVRVFAGLRSDPFYLAWIAATLKKVPNLLQHNNVLCMVVEFDTRRVLDPDKGSLFGAIAETVPTEPPGPIGHPPARIDWIGRPEQTNIRLNNPALFGVDDIRDLWNQQTPFAISKELQPLFLQRLKDSFADWDMRDGKADWTPEALAANANVFLDDFLLFDVAKPITDESHLEIEKSTIDGRSYQTGGGRTVDANSIDILLTWLVNHDREFLLGGATGATKPGMKVFPYLATPNTELQIIAESVELPAAPEEVWSLIGQFGGAWHPLVAKVSLTGTGTGQLRTIGTVDGKEMVERLEAIDNAKRFFRYTNIAGIPASHYAGILEVTPNGSGCTVVWRVQFLANNQTDAAVRRIVSPLLRTGLESLKSRFGVPIHGT